MNDKKNSSTEQALRASNELLSSARNTRDDADYWESLATRIHRAARRDAARQVLTAGGAGWLAARPRVASALALGASAAALVLAVRWPSPESYRDEGESAWATALVSGSLSTTLPGLTRLDERVPALAALMVSASRQTEVSPEEQK